MKILNIVLAVLATATVAFADSRPYNWDATEITEIVEKNGIIVADSYIMSRNSTTTGIFLTITNINDTDDVLLGIKPDPTFAEQMEIHRTTITDGMATMEKVPSVTIPAKQMIALGKKGYHIMVMGLQQPIQSDSTYPITLQFENAQDITVSAVATSKTYSRYGKGYGRYKKGKNGWGRSRDGWHRDGRYKDDWDTYDKDQ